MDLAALSTKLIHLSPNSTPNLATSHRAAFRPLRRLPLAARCVAAELPRLRLQRLVDEFRSLREPIDRVKRLLHYADDLSPFPEPDRVPSNRVVGCTAQVWVSAALDPVGRIHFMADSDSEITKGFCSCLILFLGGALPEEVLNMQPEDLWELNVVGLQGRTPSRVNTWQNVLISMQMRTKALVAEEERRPLPSLAKIRVEGSSH